MRLNVYAEEITGEVTVVSKAVSDEEFGERTFYGVRLYLASPDVLHHSPADDDRSAITFWVKWTRTHGNNPQPLAAVLQSMALLADGAIPDGQE